MHYFGLNEKQKQGMIYLGTDEEKLQEYNDKGIGIFWCYNMNEDQSEPGKREKARCVDSDIKAFFVDLDDGSRDEMWRRIITSPLVPSMCIKTFRGFHVYWLTDSATIDNFEDIQKRLIDYYNGDTKAKDIVRVLRVPGFIQWKHEEPFTILQLWREDSLYYTEAQMMEAYPMSRDERRTKVATPEATFNRYLRNAEEGRMSFDKLSRLDQGELLLRLSGSSYVNGEVYDLKDNANGTRQIIVNGESTGCFINEKGNIIADKGFSNSIFNWLRWTEYQHSDSEIFSIIRQIAPEVFNG